MVRNAVLLLAFVTGCFQRSDEVGLNAPPGDDDSIRDAGLSPTDPGAFPCVEDSDCQLAAATCCECPSFAVSAGFGDECSGVMCPMMPSCPAVEATCVANTCALTCAPLACPLACADGFVTDAAGCLTCACASTPPDGGCQVDEDCVRVGADCCGCERGGMSTAIPASQVANFEDMLGCPTNPSCPGVNVCSPTDEPRCLQGTCTLSSATLPGNACGRPDLPACGPGETCILNTSPEASAGGVGACGPSTP